LQLLRSTFRGELKLTTRRKLSLAYQPAASEILNKFQLVVLACGGHAHGVWEKLASSSRAARANKNRPKNAKHSKSRGESEQRREEKNYNFCKQNSENVFNSL
jgi:hypothetical protein